MFKVPKREMGGLELINVEQPYTVMANTMYVFVGTRIHTNNIMVTPKENRFLGPACVGAYDDILRLGRLVWLGDKELPEGHRTDMVTYLQLKDGEVYLHYGKESWWANVEGWSPVEKYVKYHRNGDNVEVRYGSEVIFTLPIDTEEPTLVDLDNTQVLSVERGVAIGLHDAVMHVLVRFGCCNIRGDNNISLHTDENGKFSNQRQQFVVVRDGEFYKFIWGEDKVAALRTLMSDAISGPWAKDYSLDSIIDIETFQKDNTLGEMS